MIKLIIENWKRFIIEQIDSTWYHGSYKDFNTFKQKQSTMFDYEKRKVPIFLSTDKKFAEINGPIVYSVRLQPDTKIFDSSLLFNESHKYWPPDWDELTQLGQELELYLEKKFKKNYYEIWKSILLQDYDVMETGYMMDWIASKGYDAFYVKGDGPKNLAVMNISKISIISKNG